MRFAVPERHRFREMQALEDAINYRLARVMAACALCELVVAGGRCDEHACDVALIAGCHEAARAVMADLSRATSGMRNDGGPLAPGGTDGYSA